MAKRTGELGLLPVVKAPQLNWNLNACGGCLCFFEQSEQNGKKKEELDADDEKIGEEDSQFMKLAKKVTAKTLQRKGPSDKTLLFPWVFPMKMAAVAVVPQHQRLFPGSVFKGAAPDVLPPPATQNPNGFIQM